MTLSSVACLALAFFTSSVAAPQPGTATGRMVVNGKTYALAHAYAFARPGRLDKKQVEIRVVLSDAAIADVDLATPANLEALATAGRLHALELLLGADPMGHPGKRALQNDIYDAAFNGSQQPMRLGGLDEFETATDDGTTISGRHFMPSPHHF